MAKINSKGFMKIRDTGMAYLVIMPAILLIIVFYVIPIVQNIMLSFTNYSAYNFNDYSYVGLENYRYIFSEHISGFTGLLIWTFIFAGSVVLISFFTGSILAIILNNNKIYLRKVYRTIFILPWVIPSVITLLMWRGLLNTNYGLINRLLEYIGLGKVPWLTEPLMARISVILVIVWFSFPYYMVVAQGVLQAIPRDYYESARIDGASSVRCFISITLPYLLKVMTPTLIMGFIMQFNQFGVYMLTKGEPAASKLGDPGATDLLLTYVYNTAFRTFRYDIAATYSVIIFFFVAAFALINMRISERFLKD